MTRSNNADGFLEVKLWDLIYQRNLMDWLPLKKVLHFQGSTYLFEVLWWKFVLLQTYVEYRWKHTAQQIFLAHSTIYFSVTENKFIAWNCHFSGPTSIYLLEFSNINSRIKCAICLNLTIEASDFDLVSLLLTLNIFDIVL